MLCRHRFLEPRQAGLDGLTAPLDEAIGVEGDDGAGRERDRRRAPRLLRRCSDGGAELELRVARRFARRGDDRRRMPGDGEIVSVSYGGEVTAQTMVAKGAELELLHFLLDKVEHVSG